MSNVITQKGLRKYIGKQGHIDIFFGDGEGHTGEFTDYDGIVCLRAYSRRIKQGEEGELEVQVFDKSRLVFPIYGDRVSAGGLPYFYKEN